MRKLEVELGFDCCLCGGHVEARLSCSGKGLQANRQAKAATRIRCPHCDELVQLYFEPRGAWCMVLPCTDAERMTEPSFN